MTNIVTIEVPFDPETTSGVLLKLVPSPAVKIIGKPFAAGMKIVDVSKWNDVDFDVLQRVSAVDGVLARASRGKTADEKFAEYWPKITNRAWATGVYHYWENEITPQVQADTLVRQLGNDVPTEYAIDIEDQEPKFGPAQLEAAHVWLDIMEKRWGKKGMIYTRASVWNFAEAHNATWAKEHGLWLAQYTLGKYGQLAPWGHPKIWQVSQFGSLPGIKSNVDLDIVGDGASEVVRPWWWRGVRSEVPNDKGEHPYNFVITKTGVKIEFSATPHGTVHTTFNNVSWPMTVQKITADGWLMVHTDAKGEWWTDGKLLAT